MTPQSLRTPTSYLYRKDGKMVETTEAVTKQINAGIRRREIIKTGGVELLPQFREPVDRRTRLTAWKISAEGYQVVRWTYMEGQHHASHGSRCIMGEGGRCKHPVALKLGWNPKVKRWTIIKPTEVTPQSSPEIEENC